MLDSGRPSPYVAPVMAQRGAFVVGTKRVQEGGSDFTFPVTPGWLVRELEGCDHASAGEDGTFAIRVSPVSSGFWVDGHLSVRLKATCVRCLRDAETRMRIPFKVHMTPGPPESRDEEESVDEDGGLGVGHFQGTDMVLDSLVRESLVLALPMNPTCPGGCSLEDLYRDGED